MRRSSRRGAVGRRLRLVDADVVAVDADVRDVVAAEDAHAAGADHAAGEGAGLVGQVGLAGDERAVLVAPSFTRMYEPGVGPVPSKTSLRFIDHLDRPAGLPAEDGRDRLEVDGDLAAEAAADLAWHDLDLRDRHLQQLGDLLADSERALGAVQMVSRPSAFHSAMAACGSM